jgi:hypothetical protein
MNDDNDTIRRGDAKAAIFAAVQGRAERENVGLMATQLAKRSYGRALDAIPAATATPLTLKLDATNILERVAAIRAEIATPALDAAVMQRMAAEAIEEAKSTYEKDAVGMAKYEDVSDVFKACAGAAEVIADKVRALPLPTPADRLAEARKLPEVQAMVEALRDASQSLVDAAEEIAELRLTLGETDLELPWLSDSIVESIAALHRGGGEVMQEYTMPTEEARVLIPTMRLRWVDKSTCPQASTKMVLQQCFQTTSGKDVWVDVPFAGHVSDLTGEARHD